MHQTLHLSQKSFWRKGCTHHSLSLIPGQGGWVTTPIHSKKSQRRWGSVLDFPPGQMSRQACSWAGHCSTRCAAVLSASLQCRQVAETRRPIWCRHPASNREWPVCSWATMTHWSLIQSRCQHWNWLTLLASTLWILACGSLRYMSSATLCWCHLMAAQAQMKSIGAKNYGKEVPLLASRSASVLPSRPTCPGINWTSTRFNEPIAARTVQIKLHMVSVWRAGPWAKRWSSGLESEKTLTPWQAW